LQVETQALVGAAIGLIAEYLRRVGTGVAERIQDSAIERLYALISTRLGQTQLGERVFRELESVPTDVERQATANTALAEALAGNAEAAQELERAVNDARMEMTVGQGATVSGGLTFSVAQNGRVDVRRGIVAAGNVTQSRHINIKLGGFILIVAGAIVAGILVGATGTYTLQRQPNEQVADPECAAPCGARDGVTVSLSNVSTTEDPDSKNSRVLRFDWKIANDTPNPTYFGDVYVYDSANKKIAHSIFLNPADNGCNADFDQDRRIDPGKVVSSSGPACIPYPAESEPSSVEVEIGGIGNGILGITVIVPLK
jgi:hypothetical protein